VASVRKSVAKMYNRVMDELPEDEEKHVIDPLGLAPFSKEIEQVPHQELTDEERKIQRERDLMFERGEFAGESREII
jgi:hypothetical protein